jgi:hypothetical protein
VLNCQTIEDILVELQKVTIADDYGNDWTISDTPLLCYLTKALPELPVHIPAPDEIGAQIHRCEHCGYETRDAIPAECPRCGRTFFVSRNA